MSKRLELDKETLRDLTDDALSEVSGGDAVPTDKCPGNTQTFMCPSGATWFSDCG